MIAGPVSIEPLPPYFDRWPELLDLVRRSFAYMDGMIDPPSSAWRLTVESLRTKSASERCFLATAGGELVGCVLIAERSDHFYVGKLAVEPGMQGRGIGRALVGAVEAMARAAGKPALELQTRVELSGNQAAFAKLGFRETARTAHAGYDRPTSITLRKALA